LTKDAVAADAWLKDVAPSAALRKWFGHLPARWDGFRSRYERELDAKPGSWRPILEMAEAGPVTLLYSARDEEHNGAVVLRDYLVARRPTDRRRAIPSASGRPPRSRAASLTRG
jgi:uncharacterized protein YeaO (DUF488 family)